MKKYDIFISYSRKDFNEVNSIIQILKSRIPTLNYWFDITGIESGSEFRNEIMSAIDDSSYVLFALSDNAIPSKYAEKEVMYALKTETKVIPLLLKGAKLKGWPLFEIGNIDCIDSTNSLQMEKLIKNLADWTGKASSDSSSSNGISSFNTKRERKLNRSLVQNIIASAGLNLNSDFKEEASDQEMQLCNNYINLVTNNNPKAIHLRKQIELLAMKGITEAEYALGLGEIKFNDTGNYTDGKQWLTKAANKGAVRAQTILAEIHYWNKEIENVIPKLRDKIESNPLAKLIIEKSRNKK
jgi:hypothetical protein